MEKKEKVSIKYDAFVKAVRPDAKSTEDTVHLEGFIGESSVPDHFRLYSDASLNEFVEIPTDAVLHAIANSKEESHLGGSKLWIKKSAVYTYGNPAMTNRPQASFLDGDLMQGYMDSMYQPDAGAGMGNMGGGISQPITGCVGPVPQSVLCPINSRFCPQSRFICPPQTLIACPSRFCPSKLFCPTFGACPSIACQSIACNPGGGGGRPFDANQGGSDQFGGNFNPYFDGDLYQGYMDSMYQPDAGTAGMQDGGGMGNMGGGASQPITGCVQPTIITINPVVCGGTITSPITRFSPVCPPQRTIIPVLCPTRPNFPPCNFPRTLPWTTCPRPTITRPIFCPITGGGGPIVSIADCPSFPCPPGGIDTRVVNPNPNIGGGIGGMNEQFGGDFNPYFDGDLNQAYMENMYQPQADAGGNMAGPASLSTICGTGAVSITCPIRTITVGCSEPSRFVICNPVSRFVICQTQLFNSRCCITRNGRITICVRCVPTDFTRFTTGPGPIFNPRGGGIGGGQQFGDDFYGSFDPYSGY
jgi:hypothetical protein